MNMNNFINFSSSPRANKYYLRSESDKNGQIKFDNKYKAFVKINKINSEIKRIKEKRLTAFEQEGEEENMFILPPLLKTEVNDRINDLLRTKYNDKKKFKEENDNSEENNDDNKDTPKSYRNESKQFSQQDLLINDYLKRTRTLTDEVPDYKGLKKGASYFKPLNQYIKDLPKIVTKIQEEIPFKKINLMQINEHKQRGQRINNHYNDSLDPQKMSIQLRRRPKLTDLIVSEVFHNCTSNNDSSENYLSSLINQFNFDEKMKLRLERSVFLSNSITKTNKAMSRFSFLNRD